MVLFCVCILIFRVWEFIWVFSGNGDQCYVRDTDQSVNSVPMRSMVLFCVVASYFDFLCLRIDLVFRTSDTTTSAWTDNQWIEVGFECVCVLIANEKWVNLKKQHKNNSSLDKQLLRKYQKKLNIKATFRNKGKQPVIFFSNAHVFFHVKKNI